MPHGSHCWKLLFLLRLLLVSRANDNIMARDYFMYKDVSNVVGFSCGGLESAYQQYLNDWDDSRIIITSFSRLVTGDVKFARTFNEVFVLTSMWSLGYVNGSSIRTVRKLLQNNYRYLGVYVDARCEGHNYTIIYSEVKGCFFKGFVIIISCVY